MRLLLMCVSISEIEVGKSTKNLHQLFDCSRSLDTFPPDCNSEQGDGTTLNRLVA
jgi:hypothetical protein